MANCSGINCVVPCHVMGKHAIFRIISNKFCNYHLLLLNGLFTRLFNLGLCFFSLFMDSVDHYVDPFAAFCHAKILAYGFIQSDSDLFKEKFLPTFHGRFGNFFQTCRMIQERGLRFKRLCSCLASDIGGLLLLAICDL